MAVASLVDSHEKYAMDHCIYEVNDRVIILEGELMGCTGRVTTIGAGGLLVVKPDPPERHLPVVISDASVHLHELGRASRPSGQSRV
jgi:hypothetical protein